MRSQAARDIIASYPRNRPQLLRPLPDRLSSDRLRPNATFLQEVNLMSQFRQIRSLGMERSICVTHAGGFGTP
jgi:hypothetical protein